MLTLKQVLARMLLGTEIIAFGWLYFFGAHGRKALETLVHENDELVRTITQVRSECTALDEEIRTWKMQPWYQEKVARESLQMAFPDEEIILTDGA